MFYSINVNLRSQEGGLGVLEPEEECFKLKDIVNEELQGSMASDAVAMLSSSCEQSQDNDLLRRSFRGSRDQLLGSGEGLASSRERLIGSRDDLTTSREGMTGSRIVIPEELATSNVSEGGVNVSLEVDLKDKNSEEDLKDSEDEKEEVDDEAKDEDSKKNDFQDEKQSEEDEQDSQYNVDKMSEDRFDEEKENVKVEQEKPDSPVSTPSPELPKRLHRPSSLLDPPRHPAASASLDAVKVATSKMIGQIVEFICDDNKVMHLDLLRRCMFLQVERYKVRMKGVRSITALLQNSDVIASVKYSMICGWQALIEHCGQRPGPPMSQVTTLL